MLSGLCRPRIEYMAYSTSIYPQGGGSGGGGCFLFARFQTKLNPSFSA
jgi:hypothetical protein